MESPPQETHLRVLADTSSRQVHVCVKLPPSLVHVSNSGATSPSGGCSVSGLAGEVNVHVSSIPSAQQIHSEAPVHPGGRSNSYSPLVAKTVVVSTPTSSLCGSPPVLSLPLRSSVPAGSEVCLRWKVVPSARMEALMRHYKAAGFSDEVSRLAAAPRRPSTNRTQFTPDCEGLRTCLGSVLNRTGKAKVVMHQTISDMIASMELQGPRVTPLLPQWDLGIVLEG